MHRINHYVNNSGLRAYYINLDPAVQSIPFAVNIDIRDTINYKEIMVQYKLGPNGAILTSLNLFATKFDQVIQLLEKRSSNLDYIFIDTPGQIEAFTWSAGGSIISELLSTSFPTCMLYTLDTVRNTSPTTFMSNMLYACSILFKSKLPLICCLNKIDIERPDLILNWISDYECYQDSMDEDIGSSTGRHEEYMTSFNRSLALAMEEFYHNITTLGVSAATGEGMTELFVKIENARNEFNECYLPELERYV